MAQICLRTVVSDGVCVLMLPSVTLCECHGHAALNLFNYSLTGQVLEEVEDAKYLGLTFSNDLEWSKHISTMTNKASSKHLFLRHNLKGCQEKLKQTAYFSLISSFMEYGATVWNHSNSITV